MPRKRGLNKEKVGFSIEKKIVTELEKYCDENSINKSHLVNKLLKKYLDEKIEKIEEVNGE